MRPLPVAVFDTEYSVVAYDQYSAAPLTSAEILEGIGVFLNRQALQFPGVDRTIVLAGDFPEWFGIPTEAPENPPTEHPVLADIRSRGWQVHSLAPYMRCRRKMESGTLTLTLVVFPWLAKETTPMYVPNGPMVTGMRMMDWFTESGVQWYMNGVFTGVDLFDKVHQDRRRKVEKQNESRPEEKKIKVPFIVEDVTASLGFGMAGCERPYVKGDTLNPELPIARSAKPFEFLTVDANKAYLSAAANSQVCYSELRQRKPEFDRTLAGYWRVRVEPWPETSGLPDPAGYREPLADGSMWVTTPTLVLLEELGRQFTVYEAFVGPYDYGLKLWAERLRDICYGLHGDVLSTAAKNAAVRTIGHWSKAPEKAGGGVRRPDWGDTVRATFRANLFRKMWAAAQSGIHPCWIETDKVFYPGADEWGIRNTRLKSKRLAFPEGKKFGEFKYDSVVQEWPVVDQAPQPAHSPAPAYSGDNDFDMEA